jgi:hypothetical protein
MAGNIHAETSMNPQKRNALILLVTSVFWVIMIFVPNAVGMDALEFGYAVSFVSLFLAVSFGAATGFYVNQAKKLDDILSGKGLLVHWTYTPQQWNLYTQKEYATEMEAKKGLFFVVSGFALFFGLLFWLFDAEAGFYVFVAMLGLIGLIGFTWRFTTWLNFRQNSSGTAEVYISKDAVYLNQKLYCWRAPLTHFEKATLENKQGVNALTFRFTVFSGRTGHQIYTVRVPVPDDKNSEAEEVVRQVNMQN